MQPDPSFEPRFGGIARLYGREGLARLQAASVAVIGLGGVGSWAAEALARSGIGRLVLVDLDDICVTNVNRQLHALDGDIGRPKVEALAQRLARIHPGCRVEARHEFLREDNATEILAPGLSGVFDAIDSHRVKRLICARCVEAGIRLVTAGGAAGRADPARVRVSDLAATHGDPLLFQVRKGLRQKHGFPRDTRRPFGIAAVWSDEPLRYPQADGTVCAARPEGESLRLDCASGLGSASFVTGAFGFAGAAWLVNRITGAAAPA